jgi:hypothetical protein
MNKDRQLVMMAVLENKLPASSVTMEEIQELEEIVFDLIAERKHGCLPQYDYALQ